MDHLPIGVLHSFVQIVFLHGLPLFGRLLVTLRDGGSDTCFHHVQRQSPSHLEKSRHRCHRSPRGPRRPRGPIVQLGVVDAEVVRVKACPVGQNLLDLLHHPSIVHETVRISDIHRNVAGRISFENACRNSFRNSIRHRCRGRPCRGGRRRCDAQGFPDLVLGDIKALGLQELLLVSTSDLPVVAHCLICRRGPL